VIEASYGVFDPLRFATRVVAWKIILLRIKGGFLEAEAMDECVDPRKKSKAP